MAFKLAQAFVRVEANTDPLKRDLEETKKITRKGVGQIQNILSSLAIGAGLGFGLRKALDLAGAQEQAEIAFDVIIKNMKRTRILLAELNEFSVATPFEPAEVRQAGQVLVQAGMDLKKILPTIKMMGDLAAGAGGDMNELILAFVKLRGEGKLSGEVEERFQTQMIFLRALAEQAGITGEKWLQMRAKGELTFELIEKLLKDATSAGGIFFNAMIRQSTSFNGLMSTLQGTMDATFAMIGKELLPVAKEFVVVINNILGAIRQLNTALDGGLAQMVLLTGAFTGLRLAIMGANAALALMETTFKGLMLTLAKFFLPIAILAGISAGIVGIIKWASKVPPIIEAWEELWFKLGLAAERLGTAWSAIVYRLTDAIRALFPDIDYLRDLLTGGLTNAIVTAFGTFGDFVLAAARWAEVLAVQWDTTWELIKTGAMISVMTMRDLFLNIPRIMGYVGGRAAAALIDAWTVVSEFMVKMWSNIFNFVIDFFKRLPELIKKAVTGTVDVTSAIAQGVLSAVKAAAKDYKEGFDAGLGKGALELEYSDDTKAAIDKAKGLFGDLKGAVDRLGATDADKIGGFRQRDKDGDGEPDKPDPDEKPTVAKIEFPAGRFGFEELSKKFQDRELKLAKPAERTAKATEKTAAEMVKMRAAMDKVVEEGAIADG
jgi:hypothetical protein